MSLDGHLDVAVTETTIEFSFAVRNAGTEPVDLAFRSGKIADVAVEQDGTEVWRWSDGRLFTQALQTETLAPGASITRELTWEEPSSGEYTATASLAATNAALEDRVAFAVS